MRSTRPGSRGPRSRRPCEPKPRPRTGRSRRGSRRCRRAREDVERSDPDHPDGGKHREACGDAAALLRHRPSSPASWRSCHKPAQVGARTAPVWDVRRSGHTVGFAWGRHRPAGRRADTRVLTRSLVRRVTSAGTHDSRPPPAWPLSTHGGGGRDDLDGHRAVGLRVGRIVRGRTVRCERYRHRRGTPCPGRKDGVWLRSPCWGSCSWFKSCSA